MSNFSAVATVTATLRRVLQTALQADVSGATVTAVRPGEGQGAATPDHGTNIFLYQVNPNPQWRNEDLPSRRQDGQLAQRPVAALDLHYLLSFYGAEETLEAQRLLGSTVAFLHSQPILPRSEIDSAVANNAFLTNSDLAEQVDLVRFTPLGMTLEELSRLWSVFLQVRYTLSVTYRASVVLVERRVTPQPALPVRDFAFATVPLRRPYIRGVVTQTGETGPITPGAAVVIEGLNLREAVTRVEIDGAAVPTTEVRGDRIALTLPATLAAGPHGVQVRHGVSIGAPGVEHMAFGSNPGSFVLQPVITRTNNNYDIAISNVQGTGLTPRSATLRVDVSPAVLPRQTALLEMLTAQGVAYTFRAEDRTADTLQLTFNISGVTAGDYLFRVRIDGADSQLTLDQNGAPVAPVGRIP